MQMDFKSVDAFKAHLNRLTELANRPDFKNLVDGKL
jgi:hypothetical protein